MSVGEDGEKDEGLWRIRFLLCGFGEEDFQSGA
jgi:hypothetical protein